MKHKPKIVCYYFPQFHAIPENDVWWGKGFNDWVLVKKSKPLFEGHHMPRVPLDGVYYNPCKKEVLSKQICLAKKYGVSGFSFYHYWFDGKLMLEGPLTTFLNNKDLDIPFFLTWANETWTRCWIGKHNEILIKQHHGKDRDIWKKHFNFLLPFFKDERAIKIQNKPVFSIYQPNLISADKTNAMFEYWNQLAIESGLEGLYYLANRNHISKEESLRFYDAVVDHQPREAYSRRKSGASRVSKFEILRFLPNSIIAYLHKIMRAFVDYDIVDSEKIWDAILQTAENCSEYKGVKRVECAYFQWDNTARYGNKSRIYKSLDYDCLKRNFSKLYKIASIRRDELLMFTAWNEWSEGAYLEPDTINKYKYLEIIKEVVDEV